MFLIPVLSVAFTNKESILSQGKDYGSFLRELCC